MSWVANNIPQITDLFCRHVAIAVPTILIAVAISLPLGWVASRHRRLGAPLVSGLELLYAIPSLALFVLIPTIFSISIRSYANILIVLSVYGVAVLVRGSAEAFASVPEDVRNAATAGGLSLWRRFWTVDLPLSIPIYVASARVMAVATISLVTVGSVIGVQSLGTLFTDGFQRGLVEEVICGIALTAILAIVIDAVIVIIGRLLTPWMRVKR